MVKKKFDICIPTYKRPELFKRLRDSIPNDISVYVSDNGNSLDGMVFSKKTNIFSPDKELPIFENWNFASSLGRCDFFFLPSDDDLYYANLYECVTEVFKNDMSEYGMIIFGHNIIDRNDAILNSWRPEVEGSLHPEESFEYFKYGVDARMPSILINREKYIECGGFNDKLKLTAADSQLIHTLLLKHPVYFVKDIISAYRIWDGALTSKRIMSKQWMNEVEIWMESIKNIIINDNLNISIKQYNKMHDEIVARNILHALRVNKGFFSKVKWIFKNRYPFKSNYSTQLKIFLNIFK